MYPKERESASAYSLVCPARPCPSLLQCSCSQNHLHTFPSKCLNSTDLNRYPRVRFYQLYPRSVMALLIFSFISWFVCLFFFYLQSDGQQAVTQLCFRLSHPTQKISSGSVLVQIRRAASLGVTAQKISLPQAGLGGKSQ